MLPWSKPCNEDHDEWVRRALLANHRYIRAVLKFERNHRAPKPRPKFVPDALRVIIKDVTAEHGVTLRQLQSKSRKRRLVNARRTVALRARAKGCSYPQIGNALNRDHTTIMHAVGAV